MNVHMYNCVYMSLVFQLAQTQPTGTVVTQRSDRCHSQRPGPNGYCIWKAERINDGDGWKNHGGLSS